MDVRKQRLSNSNNAYLLLIGRAIRIKRSPHPPALPAVGLRAPARFQGSAGRTINPCCQQ